MGKKLKVTVGSSRTQMEVAYVNDSARPTLIDTDLFVGRVLVKIRDFDGFTPDGSTPIKDHPYFEGRSRKFDIQIEGRFKRRPGIAPYTGEEVEFGSDFDYLPDDFPKKAFNTGMRIARWIDPAVHYDFTPPSRRPFIMSPYTACMNIFQAHPAPSRYHDAVIYLHHTAAKGHQTPEDHQGDVVPVGEATHEGKKHKLERNPKKYWRFLGLAGDDRVDAFVEKYKAYFAPRDSPAQQSSLPLPNQHAVSGDTTAPKAGASLATSEVAVTVAPSSPETEARRRRRRASTVGSRPMPNHQISFGAGMREASEEEHGADHLDKQAAAIQELETLKEDSDGSNLDLTELGKALSHGSSNSGTSTPAVGEHATRKSAKDLDLAHVPKLKDIERGDLMYADQLAIPDVFAKDHEHTDAGDQTLGPWRFEDPETEPLEDNSFVFLNKNASVPERRKYFSNAQHRKDFVYDSDIVYSASFFSPMFNFNTFDINIGPIHMNIGKFFTDMPVRYSLRSTRIVPSTGESECFCTIGFKLEEE